MYRLPYSKNDNPNAWIEITTFCNMKCDGCYKGIDRGDSKQVHEPLDKIKAKILKLIKIRNVGIITITGGEALMHPDIEEIVTFIKQQKKDSFIHTNGILLDEETLVKLKEAGLTGFIVRVDIHNRTQVLKENELNKLRNQIARLFKKVGGLQLGFSTVIDKTNLYQIPDVVRWFQSNNEFTDYLVLILKREFRFSHNQELKIENEVTIEELAEVLNDYFPDMIFSTFLGSKSKNVGYKWVSVSWIAYNSKVLAYVTSKMVELTVVLKHFKNGNYSYVMGNSRNYLSFIDLFGGIFIFKTMRSVFKKYMLMKFSRIRLWFKKPNHQVINIVNPPSTKDQEPDYCDACPDAVLHNGKLVESCSLESQINIQNELKYEY